MMNTWEKMSSHPLKFGILTILALALSVNGYEPDAVCRNVQYLDPYVLDKPDLVVIKSAVTPDYRRRYWSAVCHVGAKDYTGQLRFKHDGSYDNKFELDSRERTLYKAQMNKIQKINLENRKSSTLKFPVDDSDTIKSIALDWVSKNLYFFHDGDLKVLNLKENSKYPKNLTVLGKINKFEPVIKVSPNTGYLIIKNSSHTITRFDQDGTKPYVLYNNSTVTIYNMVLDHNESSIYWTEYENVKPYKTQIRYTSLNQTGSAKTFEVVNQTNSLCLEHQLAVDEKYIYFVTRSHDANLGSESNHLQRARKSDGLFDNRFDVTENKYLYDGRFNSVMVLQGLAQKVSKDHPCREDNGGCYGFCVAVPHGQGLTRKCIETGEISSFGKFFRWLREVV